MRTRSLVCLCLATAILSACGGVSKLEKPGFATARISDGIVQGEFNPAGYTEAEIARFAAPICQDQSMADLKVTVAANGLANFTATCPKGPRAKIANVEIQRVPGGGGVITEVTYARDGNILYDRVTFAG